MKAAPPWNRAALHHQLPLHRIRPRRTATTACFYRHRRDGMQCTVLTFLARHHERRLLFSGLLLVWIGTAFPAAAVPAVADRAVADRVVADPAVADRAVSASSRFEAVSVSELALQRALDDVPFDPERSAELFANRALVQSAALYFTCFGIYLLIGLIFLTYWRWMRRDLPVLAVGLLALLMAAHTAAISGSMTFLFPSVFGSHISGMIEAISFLLLNGFIAFLLWAFFPHAFRPATSAWIHRLNWTIAGIAVVTSVLFAVAILVFGDQTAVYMLSASRWITACLMIVAVALGLEALERREDFAVPTVSGLLLIVVGSIHDILFAGGGETDRPYMITFAVLGFVLLQSYVMMRRSAASARMARMSSRRLQREVDERTKELRAATIASEAANMAKTEFVTAVTHELRTPLTSMLGYTQLLRDEAGEELSSRHLDFLNTVRLSGERLLKLVNDLLDLARIEAGRVELRTGDVNVGKVVGEVKTQLYPLAAAKEIYVRTEVAAEEPLARVDEDRLRQVLINLVSNGIKFTSKGGVTIRVVDATLNDAPAIRIDVIDTGSGISADFMPQLFERFTREKRGEVEEPTGSGLGLTIARELVGHMGGDLAVESAVGAGSTFGVILPRAYSRGHR